MSLVLPRRKILAGLASLLAAPAIVKASSLMPVKQLVSYPVRPATYFTQIGGWVYSMRNGEVYCWRVGEWEVRRLDASWATLEY